MISLSPAYGRDYKAKAAVLADWAAGKDFVINDISSRWNGRVANKADLAGSGDVKFRYAKLAKVFVLNV